MKKVLVISIIFLVTCFVAAVDLAHAVSFGSATVTPEPLIMFLFVIGGIPIAVNHYRKKRKFRD